MRSSAPYTVSRPPLVARRPERVQRPQRVARRAAIGHIDPVLLFCVLGLLVVGVVMVYSTTAALSRDGWGGSAHYLFVQVVATLLGLAGATLAATVRLEVYARHTKHAVYVAFALMLAVYLPFIGLNVNGFRRWLDFGVFAFQPVEFVKLALILYVAKFLSSDRRSIRSLSKGVLPNVIIMLAFVVLLIAQPDFGSGVLLCAIVFAMLFAGGARLSHMLLLALTAGAPAWFLVAGSEYRLQRILTYIKWIGGTMPVPDDRGYQIWQSYNALSTGGLVGVGLGDSIHKLFYLPAPHTDFIFTVLAEELGFFGGATVVVLFVALVVRGIQTAMRVEDRFAKMLAFGVSTTLGLQALVNIAMALGLLPTKGFTLPFLSYGGSSVMLSLVMAGVLLNVTRLVPDAHTE